MRDIQKLSNFYAELQRVHQESFSDWRFGQFMENFLVSWLEEGKGESYFYMEDDELLKELLAFEKELGVPKRKETEKKVKKNRENRVFALSEEDYEKTWCETFYRMWEEYEYRGTHNMKDAPLESLALSMFQCIAFSHYLSAKKNIRDIIRDLVTEEYKNVLSTIMLAYKDIMNTVAAKYLKEFVETDGEEREKCFAFLQKMVREVCDYDEWDAMSGCI